MRLHFDAVFMMFATRVKFARIEMFYFCSTADKIDVNCWEIVYIREELRFEL